PAFEPASVAANDDELMASFEQDFPRRAGGPVPASRAAVGYRGACREKISRRIISGGSARFCPTGNSKSVNTYYLVDTTVNPATVVGTFSLPSA
ncbi:hypothetical protein, partial [Mesorhizobium sp. M2D.F.Ca.ET.153.01.1.1]|uniref:hypothetical protein n=1 Tax=Mesorhizobium sp. M2D.F.Ca.ET.153.01.1.1 TaxID=2500520 RepID=UPI001AEF1AB0